MAEQTQALQSLPGIAGHINQEDFAYTGVRIPRVTRCTRSATVSPNRTRSVTKCERRFKTRVVAERRPAAVAVGRQKWIRFPPRRPAR